MFTFIHDSDLHYGKVKDLDPRKGKEKHPASIVASEAAFVIVTGDLTNNGYDGAKIGCFHYGGDNNQVKALMDDYVDPIEKAGKDVYLCPGNHDRGKKTFFFFRHRPMYKRIRKRHGETKYTFHRGGLKFICCGKYPKDLKWLAKQLEDIKEPTILFFHFNLIGPYSDWWSDEEKDAFYELVKDYTIIAILVGHHHITKITDWNGITVLSSANKYSRILYDPITQNIIDIKFRH